MSKDSVTRTNIEFVRRFVDKRHIVILSMLSVLSSLSLVAVALMTKFVIDAITMSATTDIYVRVAIALVFLVLYAVLYGLTNYLTTRFSLVATEKIVTYEHSHLMSCPYEAVTSKHSVEQLKIVSNDSDIAVSTYIGLFPTVVSLVVKLVFGVALMLYVSYKITLVAVAIGLVTIAIMFAIKRPIKALHKRAQQAVARSNAYMQEAVKNVEVIKTLDVGEAVEGGVRSHFDSVIATIEAKARLVSVMGSIVYFLLEVAFLSTLLYGGTLIVLGELTIASFLALISLVEIVKAPFMSATNISSSIYSMLASIERVRTIDSLASDSYMDDDFDDIVFDSVTFARGDDKVIDNLSLTIHRGDKLAVTGYSGAGKSTFLRLLIGVIAPTHGSIYFVKNGKRIERDNRLIRTAYVPQDIEVMSGTIRDNLAVFGNLSDDRISEALRFAGLFDEVEAKGFDYMLGEAGEGLSQGQVERLAIARAYLAPHDIMVLDEPFAPLDNKVARDIFDRLMASNRTVVLVSHDDFVSDAVSNKITLGARHND